MFIELTVLGISGEYIYPNGDKLKMWKIRCSCGNSFQRPTQNVTQFKKKQEALDIDIGKGNLEWSIYCNNSPKNIIPSRLEID